MSERKAVIQDKFSHRARRQHGAGGIGIVTGIIGAPEIRQKIAETLTALREGGAEAK